MLTRCPISVRLLLLCLGAWGAVSCEKVPLLAPTGSTITLNAATTVLAANGSTTIIAQVLEAAGTPPHSGTHVTFTTTLGRLEPPTVSTDATGQAIVSFIANGSNGTAVITATSGGATTGSTGALKLAVGSAAVGKVGLNANPSTLPSTGGSTLVTAIVLDINGNALGATPVVFSTTAGVLSTTLVATDNNGIASSVLTTSQAATVTASVGATTPTTGTGSGTGTQTATVQIPLTPAPTILINAPSTSPGRGLPAAFTVVVTPAAQGGTPIKSVVINWGDGRTDDLGSVSGSLPVFHVFQSEGTFRVSATVTDVAGGTNTTSTTVVVIPVTRPSIIITPTPDPTRLGQQTTVSIQVTPPAGIGITDAVLDFGDGSTPIRLGGATSAAPKYSYKVTGTFTITLTVTDTSGQTTQGTATVTVIPP